MPQPRSGDGIKPGASARGTPYVMKLSISEIDSLERELGAKLPALYRKLLVEFGHGRFASTAEIYHPSVIRGLYKSFFDDPAQLFDVYFPFGCHNERQELWVIDVSTQRAASIWHETLPDDWLEEDWLEFDDWMKRNLPSATALSREAATE